MAIKALTNRLGRRLDELNISVDHLIESAQNSLSSVEAYDFSAVDLPLPTKTDQSGQFTAYVEFGQPGIQGAALTDTKGASVPEDIGCRDRESYGLDTTSGLSWYSQSEAVDT